jgi:hypothetical protein
VSSSLRGTDERGDHLSDRNAVVSQLVCESFEGVDSPETYGGVVVAELLDGSGVTLRDLPRLSE